MLNEFVSMEIDDEGKKWPSDPDHNWIQVSLNIHANERALPAASKPKWKIHPKTDWKPYKTRLAEELTIWNEIMDSNDDKETMVELGYTELVNIIKKIGEETIGRAKGTRFTKDTRKLREP